MRIALLGPLQISDESGRPVRVAGRRLQALLVRLALDPSRRVPAGALAEAVWSDEPPADPVNALQSLVSRLRRALGRPELIEQDGIGYRLLVSPEAVDLEVFARSVQRGRRLAADGDRAAALTELEAAERLWRGTPFAEAGDDPYAAARAHTVTDLRLSAAVLRLDLLIEAGRAAEVVTELEALVDANPLHEPVATTLVRALAEAGRAPEALARFESTRRVLADELGTDPGPALRAIHLALLHGEIGDPPGLIGPSPEGSPVARARRREVRATLTSFVGRDADLDRVHTALRDNRLVTLLGTGGAGKTRLAVEVANRWLAEHDDPVWLIELAPVSDGDALAGTVLTAVGGRDARLTERDRMPLDARDRLFDRLADQRGLLVVDNCEHLIDPVAHLVEEVLAAAPVVRVLATSRELLGLTGEVLCPVGPLALPPADADPAAAIASPAVRLLIDRARAARPDFAVTDAELPAVLTVVRRLDGLPLAIELAAARLRVLPLAEIAARLSDRFRLLTGGSRTSLPRHRTLRAVVEWSWDLLTSDERLVAERLSVCPAGADLAAAVAVGAGGRHGDDPGLGLVEDQIEPLLAALVDKSLIQVSTSEPADAAAPGVRYRMLETIREYGLERLADRGELEAVRLAHAEHFAAVVERCEPVLRSADQLRALAELEVERDNVAAALRFLAESGRGPQALTMMLALAWYWTVLDNSTELTGWATLVLAANDPDQPGLGYARAALVMNDVTGSAGWADEQPDGQPTWTVVRARLARVSAELAAEPDPPFPSLEVMRCMVAAFAGDADAADRLIERASRSSDRWLRAALQASQANLYENAGRLDRMRTALASAYEDFVAIGDRWGLSTTLVARAHLATLDGRLDDAVADFTEALRCVSEMGSEEDNLYIHIRLADLMIRRGDYAAARRELNVLAGSRTRLVDTERTLFASAAAVAVEWYSGQPGRALELAAQVRAELAGRDDSATMLGHLRGVILAATGLVSALAGRLDEATADLRIAYPAAVETLDQPILAAVGTAVAGWLAARGRSRDAAVVLGAAAAVRGGDDWTDRAVQTTRTTVSDRVGEEQFTLWYAEGRALDVPSATGALDPDRYRE